MNTATNEIELLEYKRRRLKSVWKETPKEVKTDTFKILESSKQGFSYAVNVTKSEIILDNAIQGLKEAYDNHSDKVSEQIFKLRGL